MALAGNQHQPSFFQILYLVMKLQQSLREYLLSPHNVYTSGKDCFTSAMIVAYKLILKNMLATQDFS